MFVSKHAILGAIIIIWNFLRLNVGLVQSRIVFLCGNVLLVFCEGEGHSGQRVWRDRQLRHDREGHRQCVPTHQTRAARRRAA